jgi:hypothetical protein
VLSRPDAGLVAEASCDVGCLVCPADGVASLVLELGCDGPLEQRDHDVVVLARDDSQLVSARLPTQVAAQLLPRLGVFQDAPDLPASEQFAVDITTRSALQEAIDPPARLHGIFDHIHVNQDDVIACGHPRPSPTR